MGTHTTLMKKQTNKCCNKVSRTKSKRLNHKVGCARIMSCSCYVSSTTIHFCQVVQLRIIGMYDWVFYVVFILERKSTCSYQSYRVTTPEKADSKCQRREAFARHEENHQSRSDNLLENTIQIQFWNIIER